MTLEGEEAGEEEERGGERARSKTRGRAKMMYGGERAVFTRFEFGAEVEP